jgi:hypothetical protein
MCNRNVSLNFFIYFGSSILFGGGLKNVEQQKNNMAKLCFGFEVGSVTNTGNSKLGCDFFGEKVKLLSLPFRFRGWQCCRLLQLLHEICQTRVSKVNTIHKDYHLQ